MAVTLLGLLAPSVGAGPEATAGGVLTVSEAITRALASNPALEAGAYGLRAWESRARQAGAWPNPGLEVETEGWGGSAGSAALGDAETTVRLSQEISLSGEPAHRRRVAQAERQQVACELARQRLDLVAETAEAFVTVLAAQEAARLATEEVRLAGARLSAARERVRAGKVPPLEQTRAAVTLAAREVDQRRAERDLEACRQRLVAIWGSEVVDFAEAEGDLSALDSIPPLDSLVQRTGEGPDLKRWDAAFEIQQAVQALERAVAVPVLDLSVGRTRFGDNGSHAYSVAIAASVPLWDRNRAARQASRFEVNRVERERQAQQVAVRAELRAAYQMLCSAHEAASVLRDRVLPASSSAADAAQSAYRHGKANYIELLDAQREWVESQRSYIEALASYQRGAVRVWRLSGHGPLNMLASEVWSSEAPGVPGTGTDREGGER